MRHGCTLSYASTLAACVLALLDEATRERIEKIFKEEKTESANRISVRRTRVRPPVIFQWKSLADGETVELVEFDQRPWGYLTKSQILDSIYSDEKN